MSPRLLRTVFCLLFCLPTSSGAQRSAAADDSNQAALSPHPAPQAPRAEHLTQESCEKCHGTIAKEWRTSRHRNAATNHEFQSALAREEPRLRGFCMGCHAPELAPDAKWPLTGDNLAQHEQGVSCVTCHVTDHSKVRSGKSSKSGKKSFSPHVTTYDPQFGSSRTCRSCHEFQFPDPRIGRYDPQFALMQRTYSEHHDDSFSSKTCVDCHMPNVPGRKGGNGRSHGFPGGYDNDMLQNALTILGKFSSATTYRVTLTPKDVTHAVPTGDLFRRLRVTIELHSKSGLVKKCEKFLSRHYSRDRRNKRIEVSDDRVHLQPKVVDCVSEGAKIVRADYRVDYERVSHLPKDDETKAVLEGSVRLATGSDSRD